MTMTETEIAQRINQAKTELAAKKQLLRPARTFTEPHTVTRKCPVTSEWFSVTVETADWMAWRNLASPLKPAVAYFPYLTESEIEFLLSGITNNGIQHLFRDSEIVDVECED